MNPLSNEWAIKHRADSCAATHRPFVPGEYFYTLLYHDADGCRREDLSEEAWQNRNENIQPFSFWKSRYEPLPPKPAEPVPKENAEQLFRRLMASKNPPANACYVLAAMLDRKRDLQYVKDLVDGPKERDILVPTQNVRLIIDPKSALFVSGSVLDYSEDLQKGGFKVTNPNAVAHCSCGESFAV